MDLAGIGPSYAGVALVILFVAIALAEQSRPAWRPAVSAGRRWTTNLILYACCEGLNLVLLPVIAAVAGACSGLAPHLARPEDPGGAMLHAVFTVLGLDLAYYLLHRLFHCSGVLWRLHAVHHSDFDLDVTSTVRHHPLEILPMVVVSAGFGACIGATAGEIAGYGVLAFGVQLLAHANLRLPHRLGAVLGVFLVLPDFHRLHHSQDGRHRNANYGEVFTIWDHLFRSACRASPGDFGPFGLGDFMQPRSQQVGSLLLQPLNLGSRE